MISFIAKFAVVCVALSSLATAFACASLDKAKPQEPAKPAAPAMPEFPAPEKEHTWLQQFVGEWTFDGDTVMGPDQPTIKNTGGESVRSLGGFWIVGEGKYEMMGQKMSSIITLGYDPELKKYIGTWVDSMTSYMWHYIGTVDATGKILTLEAEGPNMNVPGKMAKFRDVIEFKSKNHRVLTSSMLGDDGKWFTFVTAQYRRKE
ncbi:MAG: DUF1579 domain-containing protein [Planctomycetota bacterium]